MPVHRAIDRIRRVNSEDSSKTETTKTLFTMSKTETAKSMSPGDRRGVTTNAVMQARTPDTFVNSSIEESVSAPLQDDASSLQSFGDGECDSSSSFAAPEDHQQLLVENDNLRAEVQYLKTMLLHTRQSPKGPPRPERGGRPPAKATVPSLRRARSHSSGPDFNEDVEFEPAVPLHSHESAAGLQHRQLEHSASKLRHTSAAKEREGLLKSIDSLKEEKSSCPLDLENPSSADNNKMDTEEPLSFCDSVFDRAGWLVGLLVLQSLSSFIIKRNETLLTQHAIIVQFLTMLVGAGGNAGNQATVKVIRGLALGDIHDGNVWDFLKGEVRIGIAISAILGAAGCLRAAVFLVPPLETVAITISLVSIVGCSAVLGCFLPLLMKQVGIDPAHSSTTIQVVMDILGVTITVGVCSAILGSHDVDGSFDDAGDSEVNWQIL